MAKIDKDDQGGDMINVSKKVGVKGANDPNDVMVVQAMLKYMTQFRKKWTNVVLPDPNGTFDKATQTAIFDYQQDVRTDPNRALHFWVAKDGSISSFREGIRLLHKQQLTISAMNWDCAMLATALNDGTDHIDAIIKRWPLTVGKVLN